MTGSRDIPAEHAESVRGAISQMIRADMNRCEPVTVIDGGCATGADAMARQLVRILRSLRYQVESETYPADWARHGKAAGPIRNQDMVETGADQCIAFFYEGAGNRGTTDCAKRAEAAGIPVLRIDVPALDSTP